MAVMVIGVNVVFWRPLVAWSERFKNELSEAADTPRSLVLTVLRRSHWPRALGRVRRRLAEPVNRVGDRLFGRPAYRTDATPDTGRFGDVAFGAAAGLVIAYGTWRLLAYITAADGWAVFNQPLWQGLITFARVAVVVVVSTLIWVPIGVKIGTNPTATRITQPIVQILASFPANFLFPFAVWFFLRANLSIEIGGILLMSLGAQWYILFNTIAGAQAIPTDLTEAMDNLGVHGWQRWKRLILPAVYPAYITGGITASGGAWNASIVAEVVTYSGTTLTATGLGAYIATATTTGNYPQILAGITVMTLYVVALNRLLWQRLYRHAQRRYTLT
jgi:NitT/TauT family transport system permease protein